ncbi:MAG: universal stress protein [Nitrosomonas sp.]|nr:MAG: universal stress protein [Nitrosomonas sp.]
MYQRVLVPVDGSPIASDALRQAIQFVQEQGAQVEVLMVVEDFLFFDDNSELDNVALAAAIKCTGEKILSAAKERFQQAGITVETKLLEAKGDRVASVIVAEAKNYQADLIIIGTHGLSGFSHILLGSVAEAVVRMADIPILLIRGG